MATIETRKSAKGTHYRVKVRLDCQPPASRSFVRLAAAKARASATETALRDGTYAAGSARTVAESIDNFLSAPKLTEKKIGEPEITGWLVAYPAGQNQIARPDRRTYR